MEAKYRTVIIESEQRSRRRLRSYLDGDARLNVVGEACALDHAQRLVRSTQPDVVVVSSQLGPESGFEVLPHLDPTTSVILVTADGDDALKAFEYDVVDCVPKPVDRSRLKKALARLPETREPETDSETLAVGDRLFLREQGDVHIVQVDDIAVINADRNHTDVTTCHGVTVRVHRTMRQWVHQLPPKRFARIHRSTIANLGHITRMVAWSNHGYLVHVQGCEEPLVMSRRVATQLRDRLL